MLLREDHPQSRAERLIAAGRLVLTAAAFIAIRVDPFEPARPAAVGFLLAYAVYALVLAVWNLRSASYDTRLLLLSHTVDLAFFTLINVLTEGATSPFFVYFVFSLICAMLRFGRRGTVATAVAALAVFFISTTLAHAAGAPIEWNRFIIRAVYLVVVAALLIHLAEYQQRATRELSRIATWPRSPWTSLDALVSQLLEQGAGVLGSPRILLAFDDGHDRRAFLGTAAASGLVSEEQPSDVADALLGDAAGSSLVTSSTWRPASTFVRSGDRLVRAMVPPVPATVIEEFRIESMVAVSFGGEFVNGRVFFLDRSEAMREDLTLGQIVADIIGSRLDYFQAFQQLRKGAVAEDRVRLARNLHDSLLQSLTGAALQLQTIPRLMRRSPEEATARVSEIRETIATDQRELRWFIDSLQGAEPAESHRLPYDLETRLASLRKRFRHHWDLDVEIRVDASLQLAPSPMHFELYSIVSEAVANAAKHAGATRVRVDVAQQRNGVALSIEDDGKGFPFHGRFTLAELLASARGPVTLKERIASLGGEMSIDSSARGSRIDVTVPVPA